MELNKVNKAFGVCLLLILVGCASFSYHFYGLKEVSYENGTMLGPSDKEDVPFSKCSPTASSKFPCVVMFAKEFYALKLDYEDTQQRLKQCEHSHFFEQVSVVSARNDFNND